MLAILLCVAIPPLGISEIFTAMILLCTAYSMNFCLVIFYMIFMMQDVVQYLSAIGLVIQKGNFVDCFKNTLDYCDPFEFTVVIIFFVFSIAAVTVAFYAYRVFKAVAMGSIAGGGGNGFMRGMNIPVGGRGAR